MNKALLILVLFFFSCEDSVLNSFKWKNRILVVLNPDIIGFSDQLEDQYKDQFKDRDLVVIKVKEKKVYVDNKLVSDKLASSLLEKIRKKTGADNLILIGKDGKVKKTYKYSDNLKQVFQDIDSMPMRIKEMDKR